MSGVIIDGGPLDVSGVVKFGLGAQEVSISNDVRTIIATSRTIVDSFIWSDTAVYGLTTALGSKVSTSVDPTADSTREHDIVTGRMVGFGDPYPAHVARSAMLIRMQGLGRGAAGVSLHVVELLERMINAGIIVRVPRSGTIGASDLGPGAALAAALIGVGTVWRNGKEMGADDALRGCGFEPAVLAPKDALGVINTSAFSLAHAAHIAVACRGVLAASTFAAVANADAFGVNPRVYQPEVHALRPLPYAIEVASFLSRLFDGSWAITAVSSPQQAISFRTLVPHLASVVGALDRFVGAIEREINGVGDNPVVLIDNREMVSSSHFHTIDLALHGDALSLSLYHWAESCVQRIQRTINHRSDDLPPLLASGGEAATGLNPLQKTLGEMRGYMRHLANPASLDALVVSDQVEDLASQLPLVLDKIDKQVALLGRLLMIESLVALQCHALRAAHDRGRASTLLESFFKDVAVPFTDGVPIGPELDRMVQRLAGWVEQTVAEVAVLWPNSPLVRTPREDG